MPVVLLMACAKPHMAGSLGPERSGSRDSPIRWKVPPGCHGRIGFLGDGGERFTAIHGQVGRHDGNVRTIGGWIAVESRKLALQSCPQAHFLR